MKWRGSNGARRPEAGRRGTSLRPPALPAGARWLGLLLWATTLALLYRGGNARYANLAAGQKAPVTVVASVDFECPDLSRTELSRRQAADAVRPVFSVNLGAYNTAARTLEKLFGRLADFRATPEIKPAELERQVGDVTDLLELSIAPAAVVGLAPAGQETNVLDMVKGVLHRVSAAGIISPDEKDSLFQGAAPGGQLALRAAENEAAQTPDPGQAPDAG